MIKYKQVTAIICLLSVLSCLNACGDNSEQPKETTGIPTESESVVETAEQILYSASYLPDADYEGYLFRTVSVTDYPTHVEEADGEVVNDAYYKRNQIIEERYNMEFQETYVANYDEMTKTFKKSAMAASNDFDLCRLIMRDAFSLAQQGYILPVEELPYVDITQPWYVQYVNQELTINDKLIFAYSDECINAFESTMCVIFNKKLIADVGLQSPYQMVDDGTWTIDAFFEMAQQAISDLNNDGKYGIADDRWGIISTHDSILPSMWLGAGMKTVELQNGIPAFTAPQNEKLITLLGKVYDYWTENGMCYDAYLSEGYVGEYALNAIAQFANDGALFTVNGFSAVSLLRDMESDFGIVPTPKFDETQEEYYGRLIDGWINVPLYCCENPERTSVIMEALAVESKNYVIPAIYEKSIKDKCLRDEESIRMLEVIQKNKIIDLGDTVWMDPIRNLFMDCYRKKKPDFASAMEKKIKLVNKTIEKAVEALSESSGT